MKKQKDLSLTNSTSFANVDVTGVVRFAKEKQQKHLQKVWARLWGCQWKWSRWVPWKRFSFRARPEHSPPSLSSTKGQAMTEALLLAVVLLMVSQILSHFLKESAFVQNLIGRPWNYLAHSIHYGVWTKNPNEGKKNHPNHTSRHLSLKGDRL